MPAISSNDFPPPDQTPHFCPSCRDKHRVQPLPLLQRQAKPWAGRQRASGQGLTDGQGQTDRRAQLQLCPGRKGKGRRRRQGFVKRVAGPSGPRAHPYFKHQLDKQNKNQRGKQGARLSYQKGFQWYLPCPPVPLKFVAGGEQGQLPLPPNGSLPQLETACV